MKFMVSGFGRTVGALGIRYYFSCQVEAEDEASARIKIYEQYEHISGLVVRPVSEITPLPKEDAE